MSGTVLHDVRGLSIVTVPHGKSNELSRCVWLVIKVLCGREASKLLRMESRRADRAFPTRMRPASGCAFFLRRADDGVLIC
jgi:hypothetical protein